MCPIHRSSLASWGEGVWANNCCFISQIFPILRLERKEKMERSTAGSIMSPTSILSATFGFSHWFGEWIDKVWVRAGFRSPWPLLTFIGDICTLKLHSNLKSQRPGLSPLSGPKVLRAKWTGERGTDSLLKFKGLANSKLGKHLPSKHHKLVLTKSILDLTQVYIVEVCQTESLIPTTSYN